MATRIEVELVKDTEFRVRIVDGRGVSSHEVTVDQQHYRQLTDGKIERKELVKRSFEFLLEREPKESILARFDLQVIARYFPEYEREIKAHLA